MAQRRRGGWLKSGGGCATFFQLGGSQRRDLALAGEPFECPRLDPADALAGQAQLAADHLQRLRDLVAVQPEPELDHLLLALGQLRNRGVEQVLAQSDDDLLLDVALVGGDDVAESGVALVAERLVEARNRPRRRARLAHVLEGELRLPRQLVVRRRTLELQRQLALSTRDLLLALDDVDGDPARARFVRERALRRLADPPRRVGRELVAAAPVELLDGADQSDDPLLD